MKSGLYCFHLEADEMKGEKLIESSVSEMNVRQVLRGNPMRNQT